MTMILQIHLNKHHNIYHVFSAKNTTNELLIFLEKYA